jgi:hypothetical protein
MNTSYIRKINGGHLYNTSKKIIIIGRLCNNKKYMNFELKKILFLLILEFFFAFNTSNNKL